MQTGVGMKVLLLTAHYPPEIRSVSRLMAELAEDLAGAGLEVTVVTTFPPSADGPRTGLGRRPLISRQTRNGIRVVRVYTLPFVRVLPLVRAFTHFSLAVSLAVGGLLSGRHDAVIAYSPPLTLGLACDFLRRLWGAPFIFNVQDIYPQALIDLGLARNPAVVKLLAAIERYSYRRAAAITVHSPGNRDLLVGRGVPPRKVHVVPNWVDTRAIQPGPRMNDYRQALGLDNQFVVLFAGVLGYAQDIDVILRAARQLQQHAEIAFVIAGEGVRKAQAVVRAQAWGLRNVRFLPFQSLERYAFLVNSADVCLVTLQKSVTTPVVPSKIATIMAAGRPVVAALDAKGDARQVITDAACGVWVPPGDADGLAQAIFDLYRDPQRRAQLGAAGRTYAEVKLDRRVATSLYRWLLSSLSGGRTDESRLSEMRPAD